MTFESLECFAAIARGSTFMDVAEDYNLTQSALSKIIRKLEEELGVTLFDRSGRRVKLTKAGAQLLKDYMAMEPYCNRLKMNMRMMSSKNLMKIMLDIPKGMLHMNDILELFKTEYPEIVIDISTHRRGERLLNVLSPEGASDADIIIIHKPRRFEGKNYVTLMPDDPLIFCMPPGHPLSTKRSVTFDEICGERLIVNNWGFRNIHDLCVDYDLNFPNLIETETQRSDILWSVSGGKGCTVFHENDLEDISTDLIECRPIEGLSRMPVIMVYNSKLAENENFTILKDYIVKNVNRELKIRGK